MKIKEGFVLRSVADNFIVIGVDGEAVDFNGMITLNETGAFLWRILTEQDISRDGLVKMLTSEYMVDVNIAEEDIDAFLKKLADADVLAK